jgi:hypothetical protein
MADPPYDPTTLGGNSMARNGNGNTANRTEFIVKQIDDFTRREQVLEMEVNQHRIAMQIAEDELARIRAAKKALSV